MKKILRIIKLQRYKITKIKDFPESVAVGMAWGAAVSFTPFIGFHILIGALLAWIVRANIVASAIASKCEVQLAYCIGVADPMSIHIDTYGTGILDDNKIKSIVNEVFDLRPATIIEKLNLNSY